MRIKGNPLKDYEFRTLIIHPPKISKTEQIQINRIDQEVRGASKVKYLTGPDLVKLTSNQISKQWVANKRMRRLLKKGLVNT